jgi:NAD(P)-dependent dehydrogenase (short-subunit alcohol dehydrogenase family)
MTRVCLLTGAGGLFGDAFCRLMSRQYAIVAVYRSSPPLVTTQEAQLFDPLAPRRVVPESQHPVFAIRADLSEPGEVDRVIQMSLARFDRVDLLVNAAADVRTSCLTSDPRHVDDWEQQLHVNVVVPLHLASALAHAFWRSDELGNRTQNRNIVNVSSTAGLGGRPGRGRGFYGASKAALNVLTTQMADEYRQLGVRANALAPTFFPEVLPKQRVVRAVRTLDAGQVSGRTLVMEAEETYWL